MIFIGIIVKASFIDMANSMNVVNRNDIIFKLLQFILTTFETKYEHNSKSVNKVCNTYREFLQHPCDTSVNFFIDEY